MPDFATTPPIPYVPIADKAAEVRTAIDAARLSAANSFGGLQKLAIPGPFATDAEASTGGVPDDNLYYRSDGTVRAASHISLDLAFALDKTLTARTGPTPTFSRASSGLFTNADGILVGKTAGTTVSLDPTTTTVGTTEVTVAVASGSVVGWLVGQSVSLIVDSNANNAPDTGELWLVGDIVSTTATQLVFKVTSKGSTSASATAWTLGYRGARFDHDPITGVCKGLLIEESRTNLFARSEEFDSSVWLKLRASVDDNAATDPAGTLNADKLIEDNSANNHTIYRLISLGSLVAHTISVYAKADGRNFLYLQCGDGFPSGCTAYFDLSTGIKGTVGANATANIEPAGNGWYRCSVTATPTTIVTNGFYIYTAIANGSLNYTGDGASGIFIWGAQLEVGAFATSYIPTTTGTAVRSADVCSIIDTSWLSSNTAIGESAVIEFTPSHSTDQNARVIFGGSTTGNTASRFNLSMSIVNGPRLLYYNGSTSERTDIRYNNFPSAFTLNQTTRIAFAGGAGVFAKAAMGGSLSVGQDSTIPTDSTPLNYFGIGHRLAAGTTACIHIARIQYFKKRLSNAKLQTLTTS